MLHHPSGLTAIRSTRELQSTERSRSERMPCAASMPGSTGSHRLPFRMPWERRRVSASSWQSAQKSRKATGTSLASPVPLCEVPRRERSILYRKFAHSQSSCESAGTASLLQEADGKIRHRKYRSRAEQQRARSTRENAASVPACYYEIFEFPFVPCIFDPAAVYSGPRATMFSLWLLKPKANNGCLIEG